VGDEAKEDETLFDSFFSDKTGGPRGLNYKNGVPQILCKPSISVSVNYSVFPPNQRAGKNNG